MNTTEESDRVTGRSDDVYWLAFCYLGNELTPAQTVDFESRLADDLEAQVALTEVMALASATHHSIAELGGGRLNYRSPISGTDGSGFQWRWVAAVVAAVAGVLVSIPVWQLFNADGGQQSTAANEVELWERSTEIYQSVAVDRYDYDDPCGAVNINVEGDFLDDPENIDNELLLDRDLTSIFASALALSGQTKSEM